MDTLLLAAAVDRLTTLAWMRTKDGEKNRNRPPSILARLTGNTEGTEQNDIQTFDTPEAFREAQEAIRKGG